MSTAYRLPLPHIAFVDLRQLSGNDLIPLLDEETEWWEQVLQWDFRASAELVVKFIDMKALSGCALLVDGVVAGYTYFILEDNKGLLGDVYLMRRYREIELEYRLVERSIDMLVAECKVHRVESQLLLSASPLERPMPYSPMLRSHHRLFMVRECGVTPLRETRAGDNLLFESWREERIEDAAMLLWHGYFGHIDSLINDQYQTFSGSRKFLTNLIQYPGCGRFFQPGSFLVFRQDTGRPCGVILSSLVFDGVGHVTQICVGTESRGFGYGYEIMRRAIAEMENSGCERISLTVTSANASAVRLYEQMGFEVRREFAAHVWEGL